jgi:transposase
MTAALGLLLEAIQKECEELRFGIVERDKKIVERDKKIVERDHQILSLQEQLDWLKRQIFGKKSERVASHPHPDQLVFEGFLVPPAPPPEQSQTVTYERRTKPERHGQDAIQLDPDIPVKTTFLDIPEKDKVCKETGVPLVKIGEEVSHKLAYTPGSYYIKKMVRPKYAHPQQPEAGIWTAPLPDSLLTKCQADDSLLASIIVNKFANHMPLYRIAEQMGRDGVGISRKLLSQWVMRCGRALKPLYETMVQEILASQNVFIDESPVKLQAKEKCDTGYVWVLAGGQKADPPYRVYDFRSNRCHHHAWDILKDYQGVLHSDKYAAYQRLAEAKKLIWSPCFAHIRRKFFEAEAGDPPFREWVLRKIKHLFMLERVAWTRPPNERLRIRQEKEAPIIDELTAKIKARLVDGKLLPKSKFREALGYYLGLSPYLKNYTQHPFARMDNNVAERAIRPLTIGRKNWLFFGSEDGGEAGTILLSFVQTCRGLGIHPAEYLEDIFRRLMGHNSQKLKELLPDHWLAAKKSAMQKPS